MPPMRLKTDYYHYSDISDGMHPTLMIRGGQSQTACASSHVTAPAEGSRRRGSRDRSVVFPLPLAPTIATR
jgi:hypothetical protein